MRTTTRVTYIEVVQAAVEALVTRLDEPPALDALAAQACLSPFHFHRVFRGMVGESPGEFHRRLRLERAAHRLLTGQDSITEIAFEAGYEAHEAFIRAFRAAYCQTPSAFRARGRRQVELAARSGVHYDPEGRVPPFVPCDTGGKDMNVDILDRPELRIGAVRHIGPYHQISGAFDRMCQIVNPTGIFTMEEAKVLAVYYDDPEKTPANELRSDAAIVLPDGEPCPAGLNESTLPAGRYARFIHLGPYEQLGDAWARFMGEWLPSSGHRVGPGTTYEVYMNDPRGVKPEEIRTDLYIPIE